MQRVGAPSERRRKLITENECLHFFPADYTHACRSGKARKADEAGWLDARGSLLGNCFSPAIVAVLVGDWTDGDPALGRFIEAHNRAGVPLYLWYPKGAATPRVLPQVLTPAMLASLPSGG